MSTYEESRAAYWEAQRQFRSTAVDEIIRLLPEDAVSVELEMSDMTPRLRAGRIFDAVGNEVEDDEAWGDIDSVAADMEAYDWDEADSFLTRSGDTGGFIIERITAS